VNKEREYLKQLNDLFDRDQIIYNPNIETFKKADIFTLFQEIEELLQENKK
jgi:hypothetical protein